MGGTRGKILSPCIDTDYELCWLYWNSTAFRLMIKKCFIIALNEGQEIILDLETTYILGPEPKT